MNTRPHCHTKFEALRADAPGRHAIACENCESERTARVLSVFFATSGGQAVSGMSEGGCACGGACSCGHSHN